MEKTYSVEANTFHKLVAWPNGKALDYESRDSRFDPWRDHFAISSFGGELLFWCLIACMICFAVVVGILSREEDFRGSFGCR